MCLKKAYQPARTCSPGSRQGTHANGARPGDFQRISQLIEKYADLPMDFIEAVVVALCEPLGVNHIASVDRHFTI
jgi:uncharacterized protein